MRNSPRIADASAALGKLMLEVTNFSNSRLERIGERLSAVKPGDMVEEKITVFMQKVLALYQEKNADHIEAVEKGEIALAQKSFNEKELLHAMLAFFATAAAPPELQGTSYDWYIRKGFVLAYRKTPSKAEADGAASAPAPLNKKKLN